MRAASRGDNRPVAIEAMVERLAREELHDDVRPTVFSDALVVNLNDVLAAESGSRARLVHETFTNFWAARVFGIDELHGHARAEALVDALPDGPHSAAPEEAREPILSGDDRRRRSGVVRGGHEARRTINHQVSWRARFRLSHENQPKGRWSGDRAMRKSHECQSARPRGAFPL